MAKAHPIAHPILFHPSDLSLKRCSKCKGFWPFASFHRNRSTRDGFNNQCKRCANQAQRKSRYHDSEKSRKRVREFSRRRKGVVFTDEDYKAMHAAQNGLCAICGQPQKCKTRTGLTDMLHVDHDHTTKKVRQLLCGSCNRGLGCFFDNPALLQAAIEYLRRHGKAD